MDAQSGLIEELKIKTETFYALQNVRIQAQLRIKAFVRDNRLGKERAKALHFWLDEELKRKEDYIKGDVATILKDVNIWTKFMKRILGIGPCLAGSLIAGIQDPSRFNHVASLWKYMGQDVILETGEAPRRSKGNKITWNPFLRMTVHKLTDSFVKQNPEKSLYRRLYDTKKKFYQARFPEHALCRACGSPQMVKPSSKKKKTDGEEVKDRDAAVKTYICSNRECKETGSGIIHPTRKTKEGKPIYYHTRDHIHRMAKRYAGKIFIQHLWVVWREMNELPISRPWIIEHGGHVDYISPDEAS